MAKFLSERDKVSKVLLLQLIQKNDTPEEVREHAIKSYEKWYNKKYKG